ncbi:zinc finger BED domain-containing protein RICESLEEPER 2-like [Cucumis melo var. makuwa]|uniref:Zinc finger BED domain-containing protein RICESLEEPER 2-like n=1 Tax=Cucumis melo var. makuwa TaxID=1194695 RepID=A0A5A7UL54_CUCMM|nr:zinc finger BED domain-containing protein RICESLEEPER 2-like [Cucumis melo var. makuwa]
MNNDQFEVLGHMARDILAIPISTVASKSAFNTGGHVVDSSRCSLAPKTVEALICTQNWLNSDPIDLQIQHELEEASKFEEDRVVMENEKELEDLPDFDKRFGRKTDLNRLLLTPATTVRVLLALTKESQAITSTLRDLSARNNVVDSVLCELQPLLPSSSAAGSSS